MATYKQPLYDFENKLKLMIGGWYWSGCFGQIGTEYLWNQKSKQLGLEAWYANHAYAKIKGLGKRVSDCGLHKFPMWLQPDGSVPYQPIPNTDLNESMLFNKAKIDGCKWGVISTIPLSRKMIIVHYSGHMGIYMGDGTVMESRGGAYGIVFTKLSERPWTYWFENPFIDYEEKDMAIIERTDPTIKGDEVLTVQKGLNQFGATLTLDSSFGGLSEIAQKSFETKYGLAVNGKVDFIDLIKMISLYDVKVISLQKEVADAKKTNSILTNNINELTTALTNARKTIETENANLDAAILEVNTLTAKADGLIKSLAELNEKAKALDESNTELVFQNTSLTEDLRVANLIKAELNDTIDELHSDMEFIEADVIRLKAELLAKPIPVISWEDATLGQLLKQIGKIIFNLKA